MLSESLQDFVTYDQTHLTGDEKGESADFLDRLFRALGHDGIKEAGATRDKRFALQLLVALVSECGQLLARYPQN